MNTALNASALQQKPPSASSVPPNKIWIKMINSEDFTPIIKTMLREGVAKSEARARDLCVAFCQWFAVRIIAQGKPFLMFKGQVDETFHCFVLNTEFYAAFCKKYSDSFIHHSPLDSEGAAKFIKLGGATNTTNLLTQHFSEALHPELKKWVSLNKKGKLTEATVSCGPLNPLCWSDDSVNT